MMKPTCLTIGILIGLISVVLQSCNIHFEKRRYNPGYHVEIMKKRSTDVYPLLVKHPGEKQRIAEPSQELKIEGSEPETKVEIESRILETKRSYPEEMLKLGGDDCDVIHLKKGKKIFCTYIQMTDVIFTYKECGGTTTNVESIDITKIDFIVLAKGDTVYPENESYKWKKEHGETDHKLKQQLLRRGTGKGVIATTILYFVFGILALGTGIPFLIWAIYNLGFWVFLGGFFLIFIAIALIIGGGVLIILAIINAARG